MDGPGIRQNGRNYKGITACFDLKTYIMAGFPGNHLSSEKTECKSPETQL